MAIEKKSLISNRATVKKAVLASSTTEKALEKNASISGKFATPRHEGKFAMPKHEGKFAMPKPEGKFAAPKPEGKFAAPKPEGKLKAW